MLSVEQAQELILNAVQPLPAETAELPVTLGRFTAESLHSTVNLPPSDNSAMDGYAVQAEDLVQAEGETPVALRIIGTAPAGGIFDKIVERGTCVRVFTGSTLPRGADTVIMQEDVQLHSEEPSSARFVESAPLWDNVRMRGEDVKAGALLLEAGKKLTAQRLGLLAAAGIGAVRVGRNPVAGLLATGNELCEPGRPLPAGSIYESNRLALAALAQRSGAIPKVYPLVPDDLSATAAALEHSLSECDVVISTGGVSVGGMDWVRAAFAAIGGQLDFWTVDMRPGKPCAFGRWKNKLWFGLPGNPVSAVVCFLLFARPALLRLQGAREVLARTIPAPLSEPLVNHAGRRHFMRVTLDEAGNARSAGQQSSHMLSALACAYGLVDVPPKTTLAAGTIVGVIPFN